MKLKGKIYKVLAISNDVNAVKKGKVAKRIIRKKGLKGFGKLFK